MAKEGLTDSIEDILMFSPVHRTRGQHEVECTVNALGLSFDGLVTYDFNRAAKGHVPRGDRYAIEPDEPATADIWTVELIGLDGDTFPSPILIDYSTLSAETLCEIEDACIEDQADRDEIYADFEYDRAKEAEYDL